MERDEIHFIIIMKTAKREVGGEGRAEGCKDEESRLGEKRINRDKGISDQTRSISPLQQVGSITSVHYHLFESSSLRFFTSNEGETRSLTYNYLSFVSLVSVCVGGRGCNLV